MRKPPKATLLLVATLGVSRSGENISEDFREVFSREAKKYDAYFTTAEALVNSNYCLLSNSVHSVGSTLFVDDTNNVLPATTWERMAPRFKTIVVISYATGLNAGEYDTSCIVADSGKVVAPFTSAGNCFHFRLVDRVMPADILEQLQDVFPYQKLLIDVRDEVLASFFLHHGDIERLEVVFSSQLAEHMCSVAMFRSLVESGKTTSYHPKFTSPEVLKREGSLVLVSSDVRYTG